MANIFNSTPVYYFQIPNDVIEDKRIWRRLTPSSKCAYAYLCFAAQKHSNKHNRAGLQFTDQQLADGAGISVKSIPAVRKQLSKEMSLLQIDFEKGAGHTYRILDPVTGRALERVQDFDKLSSDLLEEFFREHLGEYDLEHKNTSQLCCRCPFHDTSKLRSRDLHIDLLKGGAWKCFKCEVGGKLVRLERLMADRKGEYMTDSAAHHRVQRRMEGFIRRQRELEAAELADRRKELFGDSPGPNI